MKTWVWMAAAAAVWMVACGQEADKSKVKTPTKESNATGAVVSGRVRLAEGFTLPEYVKLDMERKIFGAEQAAIPEMCSPPKKHDRAPVRLTEEGYLSGLMVAASNFTGAKPRPPKTHKVTIKDCRLTPTLVVAMTGDRLEVRSEVDFPFMPTFGPSTGARTLMPGQKEEANLDRAGVESVLCTYTAPCGRTDVITLHHPIAAITDASGRFRLEDFPIDQQVTINAWHPLFEEANVSVTVGRGEKKEVDIVISPKARFQTAAGKAGVHDDLTGTPLQRSVPSGDSQAAEASEEAPEEKPTTE